MHINKNEMRKVRKQEQIPRSFSQLDKTKKP
jgi:hypothetical protein